MRSINLQVSWWKYLTSTEHHHVVIMFSVVSVQVTHWPHTFHTLAASHENSFLKVNKINIVQYCYSAQVQAFSIWCWKSVLCTWLCRTATVTVFMRSITTDCAETLGYEWDHTEVVHRSMLISWYCSGYCVLQNNVTFQFYHQQNEGVTYYHE